MSKKVWIVLGFIVALSVIGVLYSNMNNISIQQKESQENKVEKGIVKKEPVAYEILDDSVQTEEAIEKWLDKNVQKEGFYSKKTDEETFVLISGGVKSTTGYGISLNGVSQENNTITVQYEVIAPLKDEKVEEKETNPHMILRFDSKDVEIKGEIKPIVDEDITNK